MKIWFAAATLLGLAACIENPDVDHHLRGAKPALPDDPYADRSTTVWVDFQSGTLGAFAYIKGEQGKWVFAVQNPSSFSMPATTLLLQANYPTAISCCGDGSTDFFPTPLYETVALVPPLSPHETADLSEFSMPQIQNPNMVSIKAVPFREDGINTDGPFHLVGLFQGPYAVLRNGDSLIAGHLKAVINGSGKIGISVLADRPDFAPMTLIGSFEGSFASTTSLQVDYYQDSLVTLYLPSSSIQELATGFEIRFATGSGDTVVLTGERARVE